MSGWRRDESVVRIFCRKKVKCDVKVGNKIYPGWRSHAFMPDLEWGESETKS